jgi:hypothetical protein
MYCSSRLSKLIKAVFREFPAQENAKGIKSSGWQAVPRRKPPLIN